MPQRSAAATLFLACIAGTACRSADASAEVDDHLRHGRYEQAIELASARAADEPGDARAAADLTRARVGAALERGRRLTLLDRDEEALAEFYAAWALEPESSTTVQWIDKTRRKLAERLLDEGNEAEAAGDLDTAEARYQSAVDYVPDHERAVTGLARVLLKQNDRLLKGEQYYHDGVRSLHDVRLHEALRDFVVCHEVYTPENARAEQKAAQAQAEIALARLTIARTLREEEHLHAARNEFRIALLLDPSLTEAEQAIAELEPELVAEENLSKIEMLTLRKQFAEAEELARSSLELSVRHREGFEQKIVEVANARLSDKYDVAKTLEQDFDYEGAVRLYEELIAEVGYFEDVLTRRDTLNAYVQMAADLYQRAAEAEDPAARRDLLMQIQLVWPDYLDVDAQLAELGE